MKKVLLLALFGVLVFTAGCGGKKKNINDGAMPGTDITITPDFADEPSLRGDLDKDINLKTIYFEFDRSELSPDALSTLKENAAYLINNSEVKIVVEGHCDDRGTVEYNLALGQRRAVKVKEYYTQLGIASNRIATISYGEEKPLDTRSNESAWTKNRRAESKVMVQ
ncbi:MAG: peptidoglycan-associated lipoprotein Pal [Endomicrobium sp.]|jgi:peptidoglycan-associated lipoprotein|nr:peptidoglycan-associated lipoprotein Pal [Endomicrobium sp.]